MDDEIRDKLAVIEEKLDLADEERAELKAWLALMVHDMQARMELMDRQHYEQLEEIKKNFLSSIEGLPYGLLAWRPLSPLLGRK
jgi:hypothetical protein